VTHRVTTWAMIKAWIAVLLGALMLVGYTINAARVDRPSLWMVVLATAAIAGLAVVEILAFSIALSTMRAWKSGRRRR
jgi:hypothetical protein